MDVHIWCGAILAIIITLQHLTLIDWSPHRCGACGVASLQNTWVLGRVLNAAIAFTYSHVLNAAIGPGL